ncbi:Fur family transcriptional regulator [Embleya sp. AB8]|uniref:Fur family transcriptional regulator n=1 Tax=Embleya sp. AB8 TaxID=3156304 RepID=UPI003C78BF70
MSSTHEPRPAPDRAAPAPDTDRPAGLDGGRRHTAQRDAVARSLAAYGEFVSAQDLFARMRDRGGRISLSTTYRNLAALALAGRADCRHTADGERQYRWRRRPEHHHLLICRQCGTTVEVYSEVVERWTASIGAEHGFTEVRHAIELTGRCADCAP